MIDNKYKEEFLKHLNKDVFNFLLEECLKLGKHDRLNLVTKDLNRLFNASAIDCLTYVVDMTYYSEAISVVLGKKIKVDLWKKFKGGFRGMSLVLDKGSKVKSFEDCLKEISERYKLKVTTREPAKSRTTKKKPTKLSPPSLIYFITDGAYIKIGMTNDLNSRINSLQTGNPMPINCVLSYTPSSKKTSILEADLHKHYEKYRLKGEWFDIGHLKLEFEEVCKKYDCKFLRKLERG